MKKMMLSIFSVLLTSAFLYGAVTITVDTKSNNSEQKTSQKGAGSKKNRFANFATETEQQKGKKKPKPSAPGFGTSGGI